MDNDPDRSWWNAILLVAAIALPYLLAALVLWVLWR